jgi:hypothetical protein
MSSCVTVSQGDQVTIICPCGRIFTGILAKVTMQTKLHKLKCERCSLVNPKKNTADVHVHVGDKFTISKYGNIVKDKNCDVMINTESKKKIETPKP